MTTSKTWLIVGPGAVGQVLALALQRAGDRPLLLGRRGRTALASPARIRDEDGGVTATLPVETFVTEFPGMPCRAVVIAVRSDQLKGCLADWAGEIRRASAPVVFFQPGFSDRATIEETFPEVPLVQGNPGYLAYFDPDGELRYWTYSLVPTLFAAVRGTAAPEIVRDLRHRLRVARIPVKTTTDVAADVQAVIAWGMPFLAALEEVGFDFDELRERPDLLELAARAADEGHRTAMASMSRVGLVPSLPGWIPPVISATAARLVLGLVDARMRSMWQVHAAKISGQTRQMIEELIHRAAGRGRSTPHLLQLRDLVWSDR